MKSTLLKDLSSLGCNFSKQDDRHIADPEITVTEALDSFWNDKKVFAMLIALLKYRITHLINIKRLYVLASELDDDRKLLLKVVARKVALHTGDSRFLMLEKNLRTKPGHKLKVPKKYQDSFYIQRKSVDTDFQKYGVTVANFFDDQPERKLKPLKRIYTENSWMKLRGLIGPDYRADTFFLLKSGLATTQSDLVKILKCNKSSISRIWSSVKNIDDLIPLI